jgi:hypothetical protein
MDFMLFRRFYDQDEDILLEGLFGGINNLLSLHVITGMGDVYDNFRHGCLQVSPWLPQTTLLAGCPQS